MRFLSKSTGHDWVDIDFLKVGEEEEQDNNIRKLLYSISSLLLSENLIVLCGLGTTLYLKGEGNKKIAPTMSDLWEIAKEIANKQNPDNFENIKEKVKYTTPKSGNENIELLLSRCQIFQELNSDEIINTFVEETKAIYCIM